MTSAKALFGAMAGRFLFRRAQVSRVEQVATNFVHLTLEGKAQRDVDWCPGDKVQVFLPGVGMRTYTPLSWAAGATRLLVFTHGEGPGADWARSVSKGEPVDLFGPRRSIDVRSVQAPLVVCGDETSVALTVALGRKDTVAVLEVNDAAQARQALAAVAGPGELHLVERAPADGHVGALVELLRGPLLSGAVGVFTGRAKTIQGVQRVLKAEARYASKVKAYWADGKRGLD
jgi:NADPH-dependent ferric siderophore reductase